MLEYKFLSMYLFFYLNIYYREPDVKVKYSIGWQHTRILFRPNLFNITALSSQINLTFKFF